MLNPTLLPVQYHPPLFKIKFNCAKQIKLNEFAIIWLKVMDAWKCLFIHQSAHIGVTKELISPNDPCVHN